MNISHPPLASGTLSRRTLMGFGGALGLVAIVGCSATASSSTPSSAGSADNTTLSAGSYDATFTSTVSGPGGGSGSQTLKAAYLVNGVSATIDGGTWASTAADENVFLVCNGGSLTIKNATITKSGDSSNEDACNFYGLNSAVLVVDDGSTATITGCTVTTDANGANAVFAAGAGAITIDTITINTTKDSSRGLDATYGGSVTAANATITTKGAHCACLATDRGNGTIAVTGKSTLSAAGDGSPLIYSTGNISATGATGKASGAQTMVIEGKNSITVSKCSFTTSGTEGMMIYQSASGDAADGDATSSKASMVITDSTINSSASKPMIYITNTDCVVTVTNSKLTHPAATPLLSLAADRWGTSGSNGGKAAVTLSKVTASGKLIADSVSSATVKLTNSSTVTGAASGAVTVSADSGSTWTS